MVFFATIVVSVLTIIGAQAQAPLDITSKPITQFDYGSRQSRFGDLEFIGGLELESAHRRFGGLSGADISPDGKTLWMISDKGDWIVADLLYLDGRPLGLSNALIDRLTDSNHRKLRGGYTTDSEAIRIDRKRGVGLIAFEGLVRVDQFPLKGRTLGRFQRRRVKTERPEGQRARNRDFESLAFFQPDIGEEKLLLLSEGWIDRDGLIEGMLVEPSGSSTIRLHPIEDFRPTDASFLPSGDLLVLERRFSPPFDIELILRLIKKEQIHPGTILDGEVLLRAGLAQNIDNMEGLAVHIGPDGYPILTLVSDNNFNWLMQRTILLQFRLMRKFEPVRVMPPLARPTVRSE